MAEEDARDVKSSVMISSLETYFYKNICNSPYDSEYLWADLHSENISADTFYS